MQEFNNTSSGTFETRCGRIALNLLTFPFAFPAFRFQTFSASGTRTGGLPRCTHSHLKYLNTQTLQRLPLAHLPPALRRPLFLNVRYSPFVYFSISAKNSKTKHKSHFKENLQAEIALEY